MRKIATFLAALAVSLFAALPAAAVEEEGEEIFAKTFGHRVWVEADMLSRVIETNLPGSEEEGQEFAAGFAAVAQIKIIAGLHLDAEVPFAYGNGVAETSTAGAGEGAAAPYEYEGFVFGNPSVGLHYTTNLAPVLGIFGGLSASIPLTQDPSADAVATANAAAAARAYFDTHRMNLEHVPLRVRGGIEARLGGVLHLRSDLATTFAVPTGDADTEFFMEQANEVELRAGGFGIGARLQAAFPLTEADKFQLAVEPFAGYEPESSGLLLRLGWLVALDEPLGFGLEQGKVATIRVALGIKL